MCFAKQDDIFVYDPDLIYDSNNSKYKRKKSIISRLKLLFKKNNSDEQYEMPLIPSYSYFDNYNDNKNKNENKEYHISYKMY